MSLSVAVIDYGAGNLRSIRRALEAAGAAAIVTSDPRAVRNADAVVFPGVGAAGAAMERLHQLGLSDTILDVVDAGRPFLGICLGMQLLFGAQEEGDTRGLGILHGRVRSLDRQVKIPQIGWNRARWLRDAAGYDAGEDEDFYFVHSYVTEPEDPADVIAVTRYGGVFPSVVRHGQVWGTQFHLEKSGPSGLRFVSCWVAGAGAAATPTLESVFA